MVETEHYVLSAEGEPAVAAECSAVLEAAWEEYRKFFGAEPELPEGEKLRVKFFESREGFEAALRVDGQPVPASGGYYSPSNRTAYLWRQPTLYYTRCLLLHEAAHQFHYLSRTGNRAVRIGWYVEGIAEYLCRHRWDGEHLELGVLPLISLKDYAATALAEIEAGATLAPAGETGNLSRPLSWALVRFLLTERNRKKFRRLRDRYDRGSTEASALNQTFGSPKRLTASLAEWLRKEQEPWRQVFNQWEEIAPGRIRGSAGPRIVSFCRPKAAATSLEALLEIPEADGWTGGLLLSYADRDNYTVGLIFGGKTVRVNRRKAGKWTTIATAPCPAPREPGTLFLSAKREGDLVRFRIGETEIGAFRIGPPALGLALQGGTATYRDVAWE